ncbi:MAG: alanine racemase [Clostridia bacterium]|nr:alanine racemase [Clostridia bacterium]
MVLKVLRRTWAEISKGALIQNFKEIKKRAGGARIFAVVKADAYGHGAALVAPLLEQNGADGFAVSNIKEALLLREYDIKKPILILGYTPEDWAKELAQNGIAQCVYSYEQAKRLSAAAKSAGVTVKIHLKLDTGMGRIGFDLRDSSLQGINDAIAAAGLECLDPEGVFTHFAAADSDAPFDTEATKAQYERFSAGVQAIKEAGYAIETVHCDNSAALCRGKYTCGAVRPGIILYGLKPDAGFDTGLDLRPAMTLKSVVSFVKTVKAGATVSYGMTFKAKKDMRIATVAAGYADGYPRLLSNKGEVLVRGRRAKVVGRICMDQFMVDVSDIEGVTPGDEVILFGGDIPVDEVARLCGTINYEIVCGVGQRVERILTD